MIGGARPAAENADMARKPKIHPPADELEPDEIDAAEAAPDGCNARPTEGAAIKPRRSLAELAAGIPAGQTPKGLTCPKCGCGHLSFENTWDSGGYRRRRRVCRNCGHDFPTTEQ